LKKNLTGVLSLTRFNEYAYFVIVTTLLGIAAADGVFGWRFLIVLIANWLAVGFAFMINDVEDAPDDALSENKTKRNPVSAGIISPQLAKITSFVAAFLAAVLYGTLGLWPFIFGLFGLVLGYIYSYRGIRLKTIAFFDLISHCLMLAGLQFVCAYFSFTSQLNEKWLFPFLFVVCISIYGELFNEIRDLEDDRKAQLRHTAIVLGERASHILMLVVLSIGSISGAISFFFIQLIPFWVIILMAWLAVLFILPPVLKMRHSHSSIEIQAPLHKPLERAAALALLLQFILPWIAQVLNIQASNWFI